MRSLPWRVQAYIGSLTAIATPITLVASARLARGDQGDLIAVVFFGLGILLCDLFPIWLVTYANTEVTVSCALKTAAIIAHSSPVAIWATILGTVGAELAVRRPWYKALFNTVEMVLTVAAMGLVYERLRSPASRHPFYSLQNFGAVGAMVLTYLLVNTGLVTGVVSLLSDSRFVRVWKINFLESIWNHLTIIPLGGVVAALYMYAEWSVVALVLPLVVVRRSFHSIAELHQQTEQALFRMADAIDQRDPSTYQHSVRVARIAEALAEELDLSADEVDTVRMAARLHDLGKIGMSNELLFKPGRLDDDEFALFRQHPVIGADLVQSFRLFREGQLLVRHHHERYDGKGYPEGLPGERIPLGSRILTVADSFDAMTSDRPYRPALPLAEAEQEIAANRGTQFDPQVADALLALLARRDERVTPKPRPESAAMAEAG